MLAVATSLAAAAVLAAMAPPLSGTWRCARTDGATVRRIVATQPGGTIVMTADAVAPSGGRFRTVERFVADARGEWRMSATPDGFTGIAPAWTAQSWTFLGTSPYAPGRLRLTYTLIDEATLMRDVAGERDGQWLERSSETCRRSVV